MPYSTKLSNFICYPQKNADPVIHLTPRGQKGTLLVMQMVCRFSFNNLNPASLANYKLQYLTKTRTCSSLRQQIPQFTGNPHQGFLTGKCTGVARL